MLIAARALQAVGAALLTPSSLALVLGAFPAERRAIAVSLWGAEALGWRSPVVLGSGSTGLALLLVFVAWTKRAQHPAVDLLRAVMTTADPPDVVARAVVTAATAATPRLRYTAGRVAKTVSLLRRFVPASAFDKSLRKQSQMPA